MKKNVSNKVGRPKLADDKLKKESWIVSISVLCVAIIIAIISYKILTIDFNPKYMVGTIYNTHVNSCIIDNKKIDCGPEVIYLKYKIDDNEYIEINKEYESINVLLKDYKKLSYCYKTKKNELTCK